MSVTCCLGYQKNGSEGMREIKEQKRKKKKKEWLRVEHLWAPPPLLC